jgi:dipeptidyl-peptidase-4
VNETSFPRQQARTRRFSLGVPRDFSIAPDGSRVAFLRTRSGTDPSTCLWRFDVGTGAESLVVDPSALEHGDGEVPAEERMRRERARESSGGIVRFSTNHDVTRAAFDVAGRIYVVDFVAGGVTELPASGRAIDPGMDPAGMWVAYVEAGALHVVRADGGGGRALLIPEREDVTYGLAEFVAAEEMGRQSGYWWSPDGSRLLVARVDVARVQRWYIGAGGSRRRRRRWRRGRLQGVDDADRGRRLHVVAPRRRATDASRGCHPRGVAGAARGRNDGAHRPRPRSPGRPRLGSP